jgi:hypothetical protein
MKMRLLTSALVLSGALALSLAPANAQVNTYTVNLTNVNGKGFRVTIQKWNGSVNGPGSMFRISRVQALAVPNNPSVYGEAVQISFYGMLNAAGGTVGISGITGFAGTSTNTSATNVDPDFATKNWIKTTYNGVGTKYARFDSDNTAVVANRIKMGADNRFTQGIPGRINTNGLVASAHVTVIGQFGHLFEGTVNLSAVNAPEASSLAMLLPGLVPLGLVMRRRARSRKSAS